MENKFVINGFNDKPITVRVNIKLYAVEDFMGKDMHGLAIELESLMENNLEYAQKAITYCDMVKDGISVCILGCF